MDSSLTSISLLNRLRQEDRDEEAWGHFVDRYGSRILQWCRNRDLQESDVHDVTQEILLGLAAHLRQFKYDPTLSFRGWLRRTTENAIVDFFRSREKAQPIGGSGILALSKEPARIELQRYLAEAFDLEVMDEAIARVRRRTNDKRWQSWYLLTYTTKSAREVADQLGISIGVAYANKHQVQHLIKSEVDVLENSAGSVIEK